MDYHNLFLFVRVVEKGSFRAAAEHLHIPFSTLSRKIQNLEEQIGCRLIHRSPRRLTLTEVGQQYYQRCQPLFSELDQIVLSLDKDIHSPQGMLHITAPVGLAGKLLQPWFEEFLLVYPDIQLDLHLVNRQLDLLSEGIDVAFRIGALNIHDWVARPMFESHFSLCASPAFIQQYGLPESLERLTEYPLIMYRSAPAWHFRNSAGVEQTISATPRLLVDELSSAVGAVKSGLGIGNLPDYFVRELTESGEISVLFPQWHTPGRLVHLLYPNRDYLPLKVRLFIEFIMDKVKQELRVG